MAKWYYSKSPHPSCHFANGWQVVASIDSISGDSHDFVLALLANEKLADATLACLVGMTPADGFRTGEHYAEGQVSSDDGPPETPPPDLEYECDGEPPPF
jgi:hypothetical protein